MGADINRDRRLPAVRLLADPAVERQRAEQRHTVLAAQALAAALAEDRLLVTAVRANVQAHVLDDPEHRDVDLLKHLESLAGVGQGDVLRRRDDHGAAHGHALRERELNITRARRHVDDEIVELTPIRLREQLIQRRGHHGSTPSHRLPIVDEKPDRHRHESMGRQRLERLAVAAFGMALEQAEHPGLTRPIDVRIEKADARTLLSQREREVHGDRRLADAALARRHGHDIAHAAEGLQALLDGVRDDVADDLESDRLGVRQATTVLGQQADELCTTSVHGKAARHHDLPVLPVRRDGERCAGRAERLRGLRHDEPTEMFREPGFVESGHGACGSRKDAGL